MLIELLRKIKPSKIWFKSYPISFINKFIDVVYPTNYLFRPIANYRLLFCCDLAWFIFLIPWVELHIARAPSIILL